MRPECDEVKGDLRDPEEPEHAGRVDALAELPAAEGRRHRLRGSDGSVGGRQAAHNFTTLKNKTHNMAFQ